MYNLQDIEDKIFFECKNILDTLAKINSKDELLSKQDLFYEVSERIAFLKVLEKNENFSEAFSSIEKVDNQELAYTSELESQESNYQHSDEEIVEEEVLFTNQLNDIDADEIEVDNPNNAGENSVALDDVVEEVYDTEEADLNEGNEYETPVEEAASEEIEQPKEDLFLNNEPVFSFVSDFTAPEEEAPTEHTAVVENLEPTLEDTVATPLTESQPEILETENRRTVAEMHVSEHQETENTEHAEGKIKLANIKALKNIESLFGEEHFEPTIGSSNSAAAKMSSDTSSATKTRQEFKLDLNDKLAFSKMLFNGSQADLNDTIRILNTFEDVEQAKIYLSDLYYDRNWDKVDDYAQRLWTLVENKFL